MSYRFVDNPTRLEGAVSALTSDLKAAREAGKPLRLYLDTEFESNRSGTRLCLLQISAGRDIFLVDPFALKKADSLGTVLNFEGVEWVLHAGLQDVELITDYFAVRSPERLFDTQIAWGLTSAEGSVSLAYLQFQLLQIRAEKGHQADDWVRRPLQDSQLRYAAGDVAHLPRMTELLLERAAPLGRAEAIYAASAETLRPPHTPPSPISLDSFRNAWQLSERSQAALRFLIGWYNGLSKRERKYAPEGKVLLSIAARCPSDVASLSRIKGVTRSVVDMHGRTLVAGMAQAVASADSADFVPLDPPPYSTFEEVRLEAWLANWRAHLAISLKFAPELVLPGKLIKDIKANLQVHGKEAILEALTGYRLELIEKESQRFCESSPPPV